MAGLRASAGRRYWWQVKLLAMQEFPQGLPTLQEGALSSLDPPPQPLRVAAMMAATAADAAVRKSVFMGVPGMITANAP